MKRFILVSTLILASFFASAQTQQGYVKTKGRLDAKGNLIPGQGLKGATVSVQGRTAVLVNNDDGKFSFPVTTDQFRLDSVKKKGYQLVDMEACPRTYNYSSNPLYLVMETPEQQLQDQLAAERKIRRTLTNQLHQREDEIEALKEQQKITEEEYRQALQKLYEDTNQNNQLVEDMVERYSKIDYDQLNEFDQLISNYILNGELTKADSLVNTKGNINERVSQYKKHEAINAKEREELVERQEQLQQSEALAIQERDDLAKDLYHKFEIFKMQHENDSAAYYIELRSKLDTTNAEWLNNAGAYIRDYIGDYEKSLHYFEQALELNVTNYGEDSFQAAESYCFIAVNYDIQNKYDLALEYFIKSLSYELSKGQETVGLATCYNNIGATYFYLGKDSLALDYADKALAIKNKLLDADDIEFASSYTLIGYIKLKQGNLDESYNLAKKALHISEKTLGTLHPDVARRYANLATTLQYKHDYQSALEYYEKALNIEQELYGKTHSDIANLYNSIGAIYTRFGNYEKAIEYIEKALEIRTNAFGPVHSETADTYNLLGTMYYFQANYQKAIEYVSKALEIREIVLGQNHRSVAESLSNLGAIYFSKGDNSKAREFMLRALSIYQNFYGEYNIELATSYEHIGLTYLMDGDYQKALEYCQHSFSIKVQQYGEDDPSLAPTYRNIGHIYGRLNDYPLALEYYKKALALNEQYYGEGHQDTKLTKQSIQQVEQKQIANDTEEMRKYVFTVTATVDNNSSEQQWLKDECIILEYNNWTIDDTSSLFDIDSETRDKPLKLLVLKDNDFATYDLEKKTGISIRLKQIGLEEKEKVAESYHQWKANQKESKEEQ